jgi:uncharacterized LabA/DUF88 family protein
MKDKALALTFIDFENIVKEAEQTYDSILDFDKFVEEINSIHDQYHLKNCGMFAYGDFDEGEYGVQTRLYRLGIQAKHVVTKEPERYRANASDIELSLDVLSFVYENPLINHYLFISGDGDLIHVIQRLRLKGKTVHLMASERVNLRLKSIADSVTIYDKKAPFLHPITKEDQEKWAKALIDDRDVGLILYHLNKLQQQKEFVAFSYFHRVISNKFDRRKMDEALTKARKCGLITSSYRENPNDPKNPTSVIEVNKESKTALEILSKMEKD